MENKGTSVRLTKAFREFIENERASSILLIACTVVSLLLANLIIGQPYVDFWRTPIDPLTGKNLTVELWINDLLMAIFFLLIGLELKRELYVGELSSVKRALLPLFAALGGIVVPAAIHFAFNRGTPTQAGMGIPMATDIAFALGVLSLLGNRVPASLKVFLAALAVIDDLGAILVIAIFYTSDLSLAYLAMSFGVLAVLAVLNRAGVMSLVPYLLLGAFMWYFMLKSGVHATIAGVLLASSIPFKRRQDGSSPSGALEHFLHKPVAFLILPVFALANTGILIESGWAEDFTTSNSLGIMLGLVFGKPVGIALLSFAVIALGICKLPLDLNRKHIIGAGMLGGIGFTMSIFITNLAFGSDDNLITASKMAILLASLVAGVIGFAFLKLFGAPNEGDTDMDTMNFEAEGPGK